VKLSLLLGGVLLLIGWGTYQRKRWIARDATRINGLIAQNAATPRYEGVDEDARGRAEERRRRAALTAQATRKIQTNDRRPSGDVLHIVPKKESA
jgi:hypothetical protein